MIETKKEIKLVVEEAVLRRIKQSNPSIDIESYLRMRLYKLDTSLREEIPGILIECKGCGHEWKYTGNVSRIRCHKCGRHIRTGLKPTKRDGNHPSM